MFFENGEDLRGVLEPNKDQVSSRDRAEMDCHVLLFSFPTVYNFKNVPLREMKNLLWHRNSIFSLQMLTKRCIQNPLLSKIFTLVCLGVSNCRLFSDLGPYQQPSREALSTFQDVTVAGVGKKTRFSFVSYSNDLSSAIVIRSCLSAHHGQFLFPTSLFDHKCQLWPHINASFRSIEILLQ